MNIDLKTNNIYICTQSSDISVVNFSTFQQLNSDWSSAYPNLGYGTSINFNSDYSIFYIGGSSGMLSPQIYQFSSNSYQSTGNTIITNFGTSQQIVKMDIMKDQSIIAVHNNPNGSYQMAILNITSLSLQYTLNDCQNNITSIHYDANLNQIFATSQDNYIRIFSQTANSQFQQSTLLNVDIIGIPYDLSADISGMLYAIIGSSLVQFTYNYDGTISTSSITNQFLLTGQGSSMTISPDQNYILVGCQNGDVNIFSFSTTGQGNFQVNQIILIVCFAATFVVLIPCLIRHFFCKKNEEEIQYNPNNVMKKKNLSINIEWTMQDIHPVVS